MLTCKQTTRLVSQAQDKTLSWKNRLLVRLHLLICSHCRNFNAHLGLLRKAMRHANTHPERLTEHGPKLTPERKRRILEKLRKTLQNPPSSGGPPPS